jgi:hypothetical protein
MGDLIEEFGRDDFTELIVFMLIQVRFKIAQM